MIIIFSVDSDFSTTNVIDWLDYYNAHYLVLMPQDLFGNSVNYDFKSRALKMDSLPQIKIDEVNVVWNRKWVRNYSNNHVDFLDSINNTEISKSNSIEQVYLNSFFMNIFNKATYVDTVSLNSENKLWQVKVGSEIGLDVII